MRHDRETPTHGVQADGATRDVPIRRTSAGVGPTPVLAPTVGGVAGAALGTAASLNGPTRIRRHPDAGVIRRMSGTAAKSKTPTTISTLAGLNEFLKSQQSKVQLQTGNFEDGPSATALDKAIAASSLVVTKATTVKQLVDDLTPRLSTPAPKGAKGKGGAKGAAPVEEPAVDPHAARKQAAKDCPKSGEFIGGGKDELHVHLVKQHAHVKYGRDKRQDFIEGGAILVEGLQKAREFVSGSPLAAVLHAAIDRALLERKLELDDY